MRPATPAFISAAGHALLIGALLLTARPVSPRGAPPKVLLQAALLPGKVAPRPAVAPPRPAAAPRPKAVRPAPAQAKAAPRRSTEPAVRQTPLLTSAGAPATAQELAQAAPPRPPEPVRTAPAAKASAGGPQKAGAGAGNYYGRILARLEKVKRYPDAERRRGREGTVLVRFVLTRGGGVQECRIAKGSGTEALDAEVLRMVRSAAPFPPIPKTLKRDRLVLLVPVTFSLRQQS